MKIGPVQIYPDLVLTAADKGRKLEGTVEVETAESVNHLEAMAQWAHLGRARVPFHLYVPVGCVDIARRLAAENQVNISELWSFHTIGDQTRFTLVHRAPLPKESRRPRPRRRASARTGRPPPASTESAARVPVRSRAERKPAQKRK